MSSSPNLPYPIRRGPRVGILRGVPTGVGQTVTHARETLPTEVLDPVVLGRIREEAEETGYADGYAAGLAGARAQQQEAHADFQQRAGATLQALDTALRDLESREATALTEVADQVAMLALEIAESILQREVRTATDPGREALARAIPLVPEIGDATVHLNPQDIGDVQAFASELLPGRAVNLVPDPSVASGGCIVHVGSTRIDGQLTTALDRVREVLR